MNAIPRELKGKRVTLEGLGTGTISRVDHLGRDCDIDLDSGTSVTASAGFIHLNADGTVRVDTPAVHDFAQDDDVCDACDHCNIPARIDVACRVLQLHCGSEADAVTGGGRVSSELVEVAEKAIKEFIEGK